MVDHQSSKSLPPEWSAVTTENIREVLTQRFASGDPGAGLTLSCHEAHMLVGVLNEPVVPSDWPMSAEQLTRARLLLEMCDQQSGDWTDAAFTLIREIVDRMNGLRDVDSPEARLVRYQNALESIVGSIFTETDPKRAFVSLWGIAHDALSAPPTAAEVEAQPGSEVLCPRCAHVFCPSDDPLHFHHDGCPSCSPALADAIGERDFWKAQHDDKATALEMAEHRLKVLEARPLQPSDVMAVQWKNDGDGGSLAAIKAIDHDDEIVFAADGTPALEIESPGRDVERVEVGDYVVRRVLGGLMAMKREVFEQTQKQIAELGEPIGRLVYEDGSPLSKPEDSPEWEDSTQPYPQRFRGEGS